MSQFSFIDSFIEDLLNLRQMCNGDFRLENTQFSPQKVLEMVSNMFAPQTLTKKVKLVFEIDNDLQMPSNGKLHTRKLRPKYDYRTK